MTDFDEGTYEAGTWTGVQEFLAEEKEFAGKFNNGDKSKLQYSERIGTVGPVQFKLLSLRPKKAKSGGYVIETRSIVDDAFVPPTDRGKLLVETVPYGTAEIKGGKTRDSMWFQYVKSCGFTDEEVAAMQGEDRTTTWAKMNEMAAAGTIKCQATLKQNEEGYVRVDRWIPYYMYEVKIHAGEQRQVTPAPARNGATTGTVTSAPPSIGDIP